MQFKRIRRYVKDLSADDMFILHNYLMFVMKKPSPAKKINHHRWSIFSDNLSELMGFDYDDDKNDNSDNSDTDNSNNDTSSSLSINDDYRSAIDDTNVSDDESGDSIDQGSVHKTDPNLIPIYIGPDFDVLAYPRRCLSCYLRGSGICICHRSDDMDD